MAALELSARGPASVALRCRKGRIMRPYRCYFLDDHGLIKGQQVVVCNDDHEVGEIASGLLAQRPQLCGIEVWSRARRVSLYTACPDRQL